VSARISLNQNSIDLYDNNCVWNVKHNLSPEWLYRKYRTKKIIDDVLEHLTNSRNGTIKILDLGAGKGLILKDYVDIAECYALDLKNYLEDKSIKFIKSDAQDKIPGKYDLILVLGVIEHLFYHRLALMNIYKSLNHGGYVLFDIPLYMKYWTTQDVRAGHHRRYEKGQLEKMLKVEGFKVVRRKFNNNVFVYIHWLMYEKYKRIRRYRINCVVGIYDKNPIWMKMMHWILYVCFKIPLRCPSVEHDMIILAKKE